MHNQLNETSASNHNACTKNSTQQGQANKTSANKHNACTNNPTQQVQAQHNANTRTIQQVHNKYTAMIVLVSQ